MVNAYMGQYTYVTGYTYIPYAHDKNPTQKLLSYL